MPNELVYDPNTLISVLRAHVVGQTRWFCEYLAAGSPNGREEGEQNCAQEIVDEVTREGPHVVKDEEVGRVQEGVFHRSMQIEISQLPPGPCEKELNKTTE